jgi:hypothetical protein
VQHGEAARMVHVGLELQSEAGVMETAPTKADNNLGVITSTWSCSSISTSAASKPSCLLLLLEQTRALGGPVNSEIRRTDPRPDQALSADWQCLTAS